MDEFAHKQVTETRTLAGAICTEFIHLLAVIYCGMNIYKVASSGGSVYMASHLVRQEPLLVDDSLKIVHVFNKDLVENYLEI